MLRVIISSYLHVGLVRGGMYMQIQQTSDALRELGVDVVLHNPWDNYIQSADLLHCFGPLPQQLPLMFEARRLGKSIVWSPLLKYGSRAPWKFHLLSKMGKYLPGFWNHWKQLAQMAKLSDGMIALNSLEKKLLLQEFPAKSETIIEIPNGADKKFLGGDPHLFRKKFGLHGDYVLHVGYFAPEKNQLILIKAMKLLNSTLVLIGGSGATGHGYMRRCQLAADGARVVFAGTFPPGSELLRSAYAGAKVFCLPSLVEAQPLTMIEAALAGCCLVGSEGYPVMDCLVGCVSRPDPRSPKAIAGAISKALNQKSTAQAIMSMQPDWPHVALMILKLYQETLEKNNATKRSVEG
jgi:glycosyltransferase involved in cell wall biosynthesis